MSRNSLQAACAIVAMATGVVLAGSTGRQAPAAAERARLLALQREAVSFLNTARPDTAWETTRRALADAAARLSALGAEPSASAGAFITPDLREPLRVASRAVIEASQSVEPRRVDTAPILALLDRVRVQLEGEVALGLTFQGSYSQSRAKEPAYGGHASAMGPAPAPAPADDGVESPVAFDETAQLPARTYAGGPAKDHILESAGNGVALVDYDGDGLLDIYLVTAAELTPARERVPHSNVLYRNLGGWKFEDVSKAAGVDAAAWGSGVCAGDADGDGRIDLYVTNWGPNFLFRNRGDGTFEEAAGSSGIAAGGWSTGCAFLDADADGDLDLYVARYVETSWDDLVRATRTLLWRNGPRIMTGPAGLPGESDLYFENQGQGRFQEVSAARGLADPARAYGFGVVATDYDDDGSVDLFVANDSNPNFLYRNRGDGRFDSVGLLAGVAVNDEARAQAGMGADAGDYDGDGRMDFVLTAFAHDRNTIYRNVDGRQFEDRSGASGLAAISFVRMGWGVAFVDVDLDGALDLVTANGHIFADIDQFPALGETFRQKNQVLLNRGGKFHDVSVRAGAGLQTPRVGRGLAIGDLDNDGDPDLVVSNMDDSPTLLENRQQTGRHWIGLRVAAPSGNRFAMGARVSVEAGGRRQVREIRSGGSYLSQSDLRVLFGLGDSSTPVTIGVRMPGGARQQWRNLAPDRYHTLEFTSR